MRKSSKIMLLTISFNLIGLSAMAQEQSANTSSNEVHKSFQDFRKGLLNDYKEFRQRLLDQYADFLNGEWHEYESIQGEVRSSTPKPKIAPAISVKSPVSNPGKSRPEDIDHDSSPADTDVNRQVVTDDFVEKEPAVNNLDEFSFYGIPVAIPQVDFNIKHNLASAKDYSSNWSSLENARIASKVSPYLKDLADGMKLNDFLLFRLTESYVNHKFSQTDASTRFSLIHYLLVNMGYDVRIAVSTSGCPMLLIPFKEKIYARTYLNIDNQRYYAFPPEEVEMEKLAGEGIMTCQLPSDGNLGNKFELRLSELDIPMKPKSFSFNYGPISLKGEVNENLMPILYRYPQMPIEDFATSEVSPKLRRDLVNQIKSQLADLSGDEKVEALLAFMHNVFEYSTDEDNHGFEKPYFLEETLYYQKNDCEDRAIFYTWFLWNALGREAQLITFPGHESAAVVMENDFDGTSYNFDGKRYYISDPTYIGSKTGMIMPTYRGLKPEIDYTFTH